MKKYSLVIWTLYNAIGLGIGFLLFLQLGMIIEYGLDTEMYWKLIPPENKFITYVGLLLSALLLGATVGFAQTLALISKEIRAMSWIMITALGYGLIVLIDWPLLFFDVLGRIPGPVEPFIVTVIGGIFAGIVQYFWFLKKGIKLKKWLYLWIIGLIFSVVPTALFFTFIPISSWPLEVFINGFIIGGFASLVSGKALFNELSNRS